MCPRGEDVILRLDDDLFRYYISHHRTNRGESYFIQINSTRNRPFGVAITFWLGCFCKVAIFCRPQDLVNSHLISLTSEMCPLLWEMRPYVIPRFQWHFSVSSNCSSKTKSIPHSGSLVLFGGCG